jgi:tetratricopeptide (TPR) repeat protein
MPDQEARTGASRAERVRNLLVPPLLALSLFAAACGTHAMSERDLAREAWLDGDYEEAAAGYESYLADHAGEPEAEEARFMLAGTYHHNLKQFDRARDHYVIFLDQYPASPHAYEARKQLAEVYVELGSPRDAIAHFERLLQEHPSTPDARKVRSTVADLYFDENDFNQAELEYSRVVENAPYDELTEQAMLRLASIYHLMRHEGERAIPLYERIAEATSDPAVKRTALHSLSQVYADLFRFDEAISTLRRIDDPAEADYVAERAAELERQKAEHADVPPEVDWSRSSSQ